eukprot:CAMPEP_0119039970 /NCGR_PEP_ID=MMETSP1177-20130426/9743_1 /TAXON_ID=2985 /ORGANISM="Ochromonas sp, Strain CCMP1899" /LENGTH=298 /DNA_ID=CAMNT_0007004539 /DNA_START=936 /DNA_END=1832 /DNA_ORIENTATION=-
MNNSSQNTDNNELLTNKILSINVPTHKKGNFPYSRYCDPITPKENLERDLNIEKAINIEKDLNLLNSKKGTTAVGGDHKFELSASSYKYAPSAQEIEASVIKQLINQQQQNQEYYSSEHYDGPLTVANIGGVKRSHEDSEKNCSKTVYQKGSGSLASVQGLTIVVPVVSDMSSTGNSRDGSSSVNSGSASPDPNMSGSDYKGTRTGDSLGGSGTDEAGDGSGSEDPPSESRNKNSHSNNYSSHKNSKFKKLKQDPYHSKEDIKDSAKNPIQTNTDNDALSSLMGFFSHCHQVENEKDN